VLAGLATQVGAAAMISYRKSAQNYLGKIKDA
jgi:hypothetical protein